MKMKMIGKVGSSGRYQGVCDTGSKEINKSIARANTERDLLYDICRLACDVAGYRLAWIGVAEEDEDRTVRPVAWAGFNEEYVLAVKTTWGDDIRGRGPSGAAIRTGKTTVVQDWQSEAASLPWTSAFLKNEYRSMIAIPLNDSLSDSGKVIGALMLYSTERDGFSEEEISLLEEMADDLTYGIMSLRGTEERRRVEKALRESEKRYRLLVDSAAEAIAVVQDGLLRFVNRKSIELLGFSEEEIASRSFLTFVHPDDRSLLSERHQKRLRGEELPARYDFRLVSKDGSMRWVSISAIVIEWEGRPATLNLLTDITKRKQAEMLLAENERRYRLIADNMADVVSVLDMDLHFTYLSPSIEELRGFTPEEVVGQSLEEVLTSESLKLIRETLSAQKELAMNGKLDPESTLYVELEEYRKDGTTIWVGNNISYLRDEHGRPIAFIAVSRDITEWKKTEEALRESKARFEQLAEHGRIVTWEIDANGLFTYVSQASEAIWGYYPDELVGKEHFYDLIPEYERDSVKAMTSDAFKRKERFMDLEGHIRTKDGHVRWVSTNGIPLLNEDGTLRGYQGSETDITERKRTEQALRENEEKYRQLFDMESDALFLIDTRNGRLLEVNRAAVEMCGYSQAELLQMKNTDLSAQAEETARATKESETKVPLRLLRRKGGSIIPVEISIKHFDWQGLPVMISAVRDITERKRTEQALRESEERHRRISGTTTDFVFSCVKPEGGTYSIDWMAGDVEGIMGYTVEELRTMRCWGRLVLPEDASIFNENVTDIPAGTSRSSMLRIRTKNGEVRWLAVNTTHAPSKEQPSRELVFGGCTDITERKRTEEALYNASRKLNLLSSITRHDIVNQLMVLQGQLALLERDDLPSRSRGHLLQANAAAGRISNMVQFTKEYEVVGVNAPIWHKVRALVEATAKDISPDVIIVNDIPDGIDIFADPLIEKVFFNLVDNAMKHGRSLTSIRFHVEESTKALMIVCQDDGVGINDEDKKRLFEKGFGKNTGFGLFLSREILAITGIVIRETGKAGEGARFEMVVPLGAWRSSPID